MQASNLDDICAVAGYTATRILAAWYPGRKVRIPSYPRDGHPLARLIGMPALRALVREFGGDRITIPSHSEDDRFRRDRQIAIELVAGSTCGEIADRLSLTPRRVEQIRQDLIARGWLEWAERRRGSGLREPVVSEDD